MRSPPFWVKHSVQRLPVSPQGAAPRSAVLSLGAQLPLGGPRSVRKGMAFQRSHLFKSLNKKSLACVIPGLCRHPVRQRGRQGLSQAAPLVAMGVAL